MNLTAIFIIVGIAIVALILFGGVFTLIKYLLNTLRPQGQGQARVRRASSAAFNPANIGAAQAEGQNLLGNSQSSADRYYLDNADKTFGGRKYKNKYAKKAKKRKTKK